MTSESPFQIPPDPSPAPETPEALFELLTRRGSRVEHLWVHQGDALRGFAGGHSDTRDVAIESPTGSGKTLVALLIAEWLRRSKGERVLYLCPENALVAQVAARACEYGIPAIKFTGSSRNYEQSDLVRYNSTEAIGISSYWTVFNAAPQLGADVLILDDAHSAGNAVASNWSLEVSRDANPDAFHALAALFSQSLGGDLRAAIRRDSGSPIVRLIPPRVVLAHKEAVAEILDVHLVEHSPADFAWNALRDHLQACGVYAGSHSFLVRPFIPPTHTHEAFSEPRQRIYLSATLGADGDLERTFGRTPIARIPATLPGSIGRRFVMFADAGLGGDRDRGQLLANAIGDTSRVLALVPSFSEADELSERIKTASKDLEILGNDDIRRGFEPFVSADGVALVLANRYDGLDLSDDECRVLILSGLPTAGDLQEKFLWSQLRANEALLERVATRVSQGLGRTTRGPQDFSLVLLYGADLLDFIAQPRNLERFNPTLQAELGFAREQIDQTLVARLAAVEAFLTQDKDWAPVDEWLRRQSSSIARANPDRALADIAEDEVRQQRELWDGDYRRATETARAVVDRLLAAEMPGYLGWWFIMLSLSAVAASEEDSEYLSQARAAIADGRKIGVAGTIFAFLDLSLRASEAKASSTIEDDLGEPAARLSELLGSLGYNGGKFEESADLMLSRLAAPESTNFEMGLESLGQWLGFRSWRPSTSASPDVVWYETESSVLALEAKSEKISSTLTYSELRQSADHPAWLLGNDTTLSDGATIVPAIVSGCSQFDATARTQAKQVRHLSIDQAQDLARSAIDRLRTLRTRIASSDDPRRVDTLCEDALRESGLSPRQLMEGISSQLLSEQLSEKPA